MSLPLILGTAQLGMKYGIANKSGKPDIEGARTILESAWQAGVRYFDTAQAYGDSEELLGTVLSDFPDGEKAGITTKIGDIDYSNPSAFHESIEASLEKLKISQLYALLLHKEKYIDFLDGEAGALLETVKKRKYAAKIGISVYSPDLARRALAHPLIDVVQIPSSIFDRRFINAGIFAKARTLGKELHIRSVFLQGLLCMPSVSIPSSLHVFKNYIEQLEQIGMRYSLAPKALAFAYILDLARHGNIKILFGAETAGQVKENIQALQTSQTIPQECMEEIQDVCPPQDDKFLNPANWT